MKGALLCDLIGQILRFVVAILIFSDVVNDARASSALLSFISASSLVLLYVLKVVSFGDDDLATFHVPTVLLLYTLECLTAAGVAWTSNYTEMAACLVGALGVMLPIHLGFVMVLCRGRAR